MVVVAVVLVGGQRRRAAEVLRIGLPLALGNLDRDEAGEGLALLGAGEGGILGAHGHARRRDGPLGHADARTAQVRLHGLHVVVVPAAAVLGVVALRGPGPCARAVAALARVLRAPTGPVALDAFALSVLAFAHGRRRLVIALVVATILAVALPRVRLAAPRAIPDSLVVPLRGRILRAAILLALFIAQRDRAHDATQLFCNP